MESSMYNGKIKIIAIGMHEGNGLFIINNTEHVYIHKKFLLRITEMIKTPYLEKNELKFQFFHVLDGIQERNCYIRLNNGKFETTVDSDTQEICESLLQSFILCGFLKRFLIMEEARLTKPNFLKLYNDQLKHEEEMKEEAAIAMGVIADIEQSEETYTGEIEGQPYIKAENDIRLQTDNNVYNIEDIDLNQNVANGTKPINNIKRQTPNGIAFFRREKKGK